MTAEADRSTDETGPGAGQGSDARERDRGTEKRLPRLSLGMRIVAFALGRGLLLIGVVGLVLPGIQGILTLLLGTAVLSVAGVSVYRLLRRVLQVLLHSLGL